MTKIASRNLRTKAWGPVAWFAVTCFLMGYPEKSPSKCDRRTYKRFLVLLGKVLPCNLCRDSYAAFLKQMPLTDTVMSSRKRLVTWFFKIHNKVNKKLGCKVISATQMNTKYRYFDKFRATKCGPRMGGCLKASDNVKIPKRTKVITFVDEGALILRRKERKKRK